MENHGCGRANSRENASGAEYAEPLDAKVIFLELVSLRVMVFETEKSGTFSGILSDPSERFSQCPSLTYNM